MIIFIDIISCAKSNLYAVRMTTNGIALGKDDTLCERLQKAGLDVITITKLTTQQRTYQKLTKGDKSCYKYNLLGIENAITSFGNNITLNTVLTNKNINDVKCIIDFVKKRNINLKILELATSYKNTNELYLPLEEVKKYLSDKSPSINPDTCDCEYYFGPATIKVCNFLQANVNCSNDYLMWFTPSGNIVKLDGIEINIANEIKNRDVTALENKLNDFITYGNK